MGTRAPSAPLSRGCAGGLVSHSLCWILDSLVSSAQRLLPPHPHHHLPLSSVPSLVLSSCFEPRTCSFAPQSHFRTFLSRMLEGKVLDWLLSNQTLMGFLLDLLSQSNKYGLPLHSQIQDSGEASLGPRDQGASKPLTDRDLGRLRSRASGPVRSLSPGQNVWGEGTSQCKEMRGCWLGAECPWHLLRV